MAKLDIRKLDARVKWSLLVASVLTLAALVWAALMENIFPEWRGLRLQYATILEEKASDERGRDIADRFVIGIEQNVLPHLNAIDRCITCHTGLDDPRMSDQPNPFRTHPGDILSSHPGEQFGCTVCHQGQGRATESDEAHGRVAHWLYPMREPEYLYASCMQCHDRETLIDEVLVASDSAAPQAGLAKLIRGKELLEDSGCLGCHILDGRGGSLGPDITYVGNKTAHDFDFSHFNKGDPRDVPYWLKKHFLEPQSISPDTVMPDMDLSEDDAIALTAYVLSLREPAEARTIRAPAPIIVATEEEVLSGEELYLMMCSACHGRDGRESIVPGLRTPALNNVDTLAVASDDYLRHIIFEGRSNTAMPGWGRDMDNFSRDEIDRVVAHIRAWEPVGPTLDEIQSKSGDAKMGRAYFQGLCVNCHGEEGIGGIGNSLNANTFLSIVSDTFLAETIVHGRPGTAMASWKHLPAQAVSDLVAYIRSWAPEAPSFETVQASRADLGGPENVRVGALLYKGNCATCHGDDGEGGIGPMLNSKDVLPVVTDRYLYRTITEGRLGTAMPAWRHLPADQVGAIIDYLRSWRGNHNPALAKAPPIGDYTIGEVHFELACVQCHGEDARGGVGPMLANPSFLSAVSDDSLYHWISRGRAGSAMRGFAPEEQGPLRLTSGHIGDIIAYLRNQGSKPQQPVHRSGVGNPALGRELFEGNCASCHGYDGEGASGPQLNNETFLRTASDGFLAATIVLGRTGTPMQSMIHGVEGLGQIAPNEVQDIIAYMRLWDFNQSWLKPRSLAEISERAITSGRQKFERYCSGCHGPNGLGSSDGEDFFAPALNNPEFLAAASDGFLLATIARGRSGTPMRPFGIGAGGIASLDAETISDIVSYIRTWQEHYVQEGD